MISWLGNWAQGIIVAIIIATIIELILPNGSSRKYVKVVIGIYVLFSIISPIVEKFFINGTDITEAFSVGEYEQIMEQSNNSISAKIESNNSRTVKDIYVSNLEADIKQKLEAQGYYVYGTYVKLKDDDSYEVESISLNIRKEEISEAQTTSSNKIEIEQISIQNANNDESESTTRELLEENQKNEVKEFLSTTYNVAIENIQI